MRIKIMAGGSRVFDSAEAARHEAVVKGAQPLYVELWQSTTAKIDFTGSTLNAVMNSYACQMCMSVTACKVGPRAKCLPKALLYIYIYISEVGN